MTREDFLRIALRYDTAMSRAMLRALGVEVHHGGRRGSVAVKVDRFADIAECRRQHHGVRL